MAGEWPTLTLREASVKLIDCDHRTPPAAESGYAYVAIPQLRNGRIDLSKARRITHEHFVEWTRKALPIENDVVLSRRCNPGETAFVARDMQFALGQNLVLLRADGSKVYPPFLRWVVRGPEWWEQIRKFLNVGAVFDSLRCADIPNFELRIPPLPEQRAIADVLGTLDSKIELNQRMNETLIAVGRALFKSWFVDFEPVRARVEGRDTNLPNEFVRLFPDSFVLVGGREIPTGWQLKPIGDLATITGGSTPSTKQEAYWGGTHCWATPKDLSVLTTPVLLDTERKITDAGLAQIASGLLPAGTVLMSSRAPIGYLAIAEIPVAVNQGFIAMKAAPGVSNIFLLRWTEWAKDVIASRANGSTFLEISKSNFRPIPVTVPPEPLMKQFDAIVRPLYSRMVTNEISSRTLAELRDTLLPSLISGALRIPDAERITGAQL